MRILTVNVFGLQSGWHERRAVLAAGLGELRPDVVAFQESIRTDDYDQVVDLLGEGYHVIHQAGRTADGCGASIASRWPIVASWAIDLHVTSRVDPADWIGRLDVFEIEAPKPIGPLLLAHHKPTWQSGLERERELQAVAAARFIEDLLADRDRHVVLAGDFDATPDAGSVRFWTGRQSLDGESVCYQDAWSAIHGDSPGHTHTPRNELRTDAWKPRPGRRIDYVMVRCGTHGATLDITDCRLAFDEPVEGAWASDHFGVVADLAALPRAGA
jgi:endonuclease/exonuclease/phosphatase family metal-dependent hydrolase